MNRIKTLGLVMAAGIACLASGCRYGTTVDRFPPAQGPAGVTMQVSTERQRFLGELIEVRDAGIVLLANRNVRLLPYGVIVAAETQSAGSRLRISQRRPPQPDVHERLRRLSRFPQGLSPELLRALLDAYDQTELETENP